LVTARALCALSTLFAVAVGVTGVAVLVAWAADLPGLKSVLPGMATMKANTAAAFVLAALALVLQGEAGAHGWRPTLARSAVGAVMLVAVLTLLEYALGRSFGIGRDPRPGRRRRRARSVPRTDGARHCDWLPARGWRPAPDDL
jgi:hypothetical protein